MLSEIAYSYIKKDIYEAAIDNYLYVMQKSFHIAIIKPFYRNIRKELTKMPNVYFLDNGLRNFFLSNFKSPDLREDKGALLENTVFRQLLEHYQAYEIYFWRTTQGHEVDFIAGEKEAFEVKTSIASL